MSLFKAIRKGLQKTRESISNEIKTILGQGKLTDEMLEELEEQLIRADVGVDVAFKMTDALRDKALGRMVSQAEVMDLMAEVADDLLIDPPEVSMDNKPHVILVIGVNGAGKTTTIGKMAHRFRNQGKKVMLAAGDTFRAAAIEQIEAWGERSGADLVRHKEGADSAAVAYDAYEAAKSRGHDVVLIDTAGRLHNKGHLMVELQKIVRVLRKHDESLPHETWLVIDGNTGQNTINQIKAFHQDFPLTGLVITKLDGTAKGGSVLGVSNVLKLPILWLGVGEALDDLLPFVKEDFIHGLFKSSETALLSD
jgi:fused signal recognition particle receptor